MKRRSMHVAGSWTIYTERSISNALQRSRPFISGVKGIKAVFQPRAFDNRQVGQCSLEILLIFWAPIPSLEQKHGGRVQIGDVVSGSHHHFGTRSLERWLSFVGPEFVSSRLDHHIDPPAFCSAVKTPKLHNLSRRVPIRRQTCDYAGVSSVELQITERPTKGAEILSQYCEFQIAMFASLGTVPKIECPSTRDTPRQTSIAQPLSQFGRLPRIPCFLVRYVHLSVHRIERPRLLRSFGFSHKITGAHGSQMRAAYTYRMRQRPATNRRCQPHRSRAQRPGSPRRRATAGAPARPLRRAREGAPHRRESRP